MPKRKSGDEAKGLSLVDTKIKEVIAVPMVVKRLKTDPLSFCGQTFYQGGGDAIPPTQQNLKKLFDSYRDNNTDEADKFGIGGAQRYLDDLHIQLDEVAHFALAELVQCPSVGEFTREDFYTGWRKSSSISNPCDTAARQAEYVDKSVRTRLADQDLTYFKQVYRYAFKLAKAAEQRSVPMDSALEFWQLFFHKGKGGVEWNSAETKWLDMWLEFYENNIKRPVNKDLWNMVGELMLKTKQSGGESLDWWTEDGAWPMAIDDFVAHVKKSRASTMDTTQ